MQAGFPIRMASNMFNMNIDQNLVSSWVHFKSHRGRVGSASDCQTGGWQFKSQYPTSAETCMWGRQLAAMLALYTGKGVAPEVNFRESISCMPVSKAIE